MRIDKKITTLSTVQTTRDATRKTVRDFIVIRTKHHLDVARHCEREHWFSDTAENGFGDANQDFAYELRVVFEATSKLLPRLAHSAA